jgi:hypothetical protein
MQVDQAVERSHNQVVLQSVTASGVGLWDSDLLHL